MRNNITFIIELDGRTMGQTYTLTFWRNHKGKVGIEVKGSGDFLAVSTEGEEPADILKMAQMLQ